VLNRWQKLFGNSADKQRKVSTTLAGKQILAQPRRANQRHDAIIAARVIGGALLGRVLIKPGGVRTEADVRVAFPELIDARAPSRWSVQGSR